MARTYEYEKLSTPTSIRLISLHCSLISDDVRCEIQTVRLEDAPEYEAVSYVWGTAMSIIKVATDDGDLEVQVPANLAAGLRRFRHRLLPRTLWADSVCVNQDDLDERSQQVKMMGKIYERASKVLIWLGEPDDDQAISLACKLMNTLTEPRFRNLEIDNPGGVGLDSDHNNSEIRTFLGLEDGTSAEAIHSAVGLPGPSSPEFNALGELFSNSWWSRAWTFQESHLARERIFHCGGWSWPGGLMMDVLSRPLGKLWEAGTLPPSLISPQLLIMTSGRDLWTGSDVSRQYDGNSLEVLLPLRRGSGCKEPVDTVFSLIGAVSGPTFVEVDYRVPWEVIFSRVTAGMISHSGDLGFLSNREFSRQESSLPSWVPDWRVYQPHAQYSTGIGAPHRYSATGSSKLELSLSADSRILNLKGLVIDEIIQIEGETPRSYWRWESEIGDLFSDDLTSQTKMYEPNGETLTQAIRRTNFLDLVEFLDDDQEAYRWRDDTHAAFEEITECSYHQRGEAERRAYSKLLWTMVDTNERKSVRNFVTRNRNCIGTAPTNDIQPGDVIAVLWGGEVPLLLRPTKDEGHYTFVCECYVHGYMDGEALIEARKAADPTYETYDVAWLKDIPSDLPIALQQLHLV